MDVSRREFLRRAARWMVAGGLLAGGLFWHSRRVAAPPPRSDDDCPGAGGDCRRCPLAGECRLPAALSHESDARREPLAP